MPRKAISKIRNNPIVERAVEYVVDLTQPTEDEIIDTADFQDFLLENLKINGKKGKANLEGVVDITATDNKVC